MQKQSINIRNLLLVYGFQIILVLVLSERARAQAINLPQYDSRRLHFGFTLNGSHNNFQINQSAEFLTVDSLQNVRVKPFYGFGLGGIIDLKLNDHFNLRMTGPNISFAQRDIFYEFKDSKYNKKVQVESTYINFPIHIKYKSERHRNVRFYVMAGINYSIDLSSEKDAPRSLSDPVVALRSNTVSYEVGAGLDLYFPFFKLSPELRLTNSFGSVLVKDEYVYTRALNSLFSRIVTFSFHFEG